MIRAADDSHAFGTDGRNSLLKRGDGARFRFRPAFRFQHGKPARFEGWRRCLSRKIQPRCTRVATNALGDFHRNGPHIFRATGMHTNSGLAIALPLPTIERALGLRVDELFESFERVPVASASIAQVHFAQVKD
ncbi:MAG: hypothetical protein EBU14_12465, partial [Acetobacteraceae bacterium]|nr:hypothetical protein [Acetobacteraceae bacterium]